MSPRRVRVHLCGEPGCGEVIEGPRPRCDKHTTGGWDRWKATEDGAAKSQGYGSQWRRAREAALARANHRCEICGSQDRLEVHHRDGRNPTQAGANAASNLMVVCLPDHRRLERERRREGRTPRS